MKRVIIKFFFNCILIKKYNVIILDEWDNEIYKSNENKEILKLCLNRGVYKIIIKPFYNNSIILTTSFIVRKEINYFNFSFEFNNNSQIVTITLVDKNYNNLPIERGKIKLWQDHIQ